MLICLFAFNNNVPDSCIYHNYFRKRKYDDTDQYPIAIITANYVI